MHKRRLLFLSLAVALTACGDDDRPRTDAGPDDMGDLLPDGGPGDSGPGDTEAPTVIGTDPAEGSERVMPQPIEVFFSEPMDPAVGTATLTVDGITVETTVSWEGEDDRMIVDAGIPTDAAVSLGLEGYADPAGNPLPTFELSFTTADVTAPFVLAADPEEGATGVDPGLAEIRITTSENLASTSGSVALVGGPGAVDSWSLTEDGLVATVSGLARETAYELVLADFADAAGNALDPDRYLGDGALDFTTGLDSRAPMVLTAAPPEGATAVTIGLNSISVTFDEAMDTSAGSGVLVGGTDSRTLAVDWRDGNTVARFVLRDLLLVDTDYALTLVGFVDEAGNALNRTVYLGDGTLDFTTGDDIFPPYVVGAFPGEGETDVAFDTDFVQVAFSEAMDTSTTTATLTSARGADTVTGTWAPSGTSLVFDVSDVVVAGQTYSIDFSGFVDTNGSPVDTTHPYLGDGALDFSTVTPAGERCRDALAIEQATETAPGVYQWTLADDLFGSIEGSMTCDTDTSADGVIRFTKASDTSTLRVQGLSDDEMVLQVLRGVCDSRSAEADAARLSCIHNSMSTGTNVTGPAGDYFIWVANVNGSFDPTTITIEELAATPEGEACDAPLTAASTRYTTPPAAAGDFTVWTIPMDGVYGFDRGVEQGDASEFPCGGGSFGTPRGADAVIEIPKTTSSSILELQIEATDTVYEILDGACEPAAATSLTCEYGDTTETRFLVGGARSIFVWAAGTDEGVFDGEITIRAREVEPGPGESCGTALPLVDGANSVSPTSSLTIDPLSCTAGGVTWYRFTATEAVAFVTADALVGAGVAKATPQTEVSCTSDPTLGFPTFLETGEDYCVAVTSSGGVSSLDLEQVDYPGVVGSTLIDMEITAPDIGLSFGNAFDSEEWMAVTPTYVYLASRFDGYLFRAPRTGGVEATILVDADRALIGNSGVAVGEAVFGTDDSTSAANRLYRYVDEAGVPGTMAWDTGSAWVADSIDALTYDGSLLLMASEASGGDSTVFYSADPATPGPVVQIGTSVVLQDVSAIAADAVWIYAVAEVGGTEGVYRLRRTDLGNPTATVEELSVGGLTLNHSDDSAGLVLQDGGPSGRSVLYFRTYGDSDIYAILDPDEETPRYLGILSSLGRSNTDYVLALDPTVPALFFTEEETNSSYPRFVRLE